MMTHKVIHSSSLWGTEVSLKYGRRQRSYRKSAYLEAPTGEPLSVTNGEATAFLNRGEKGWESDLASHGVLLDDSSGNSAIVHDARFLRIQVDAEAGGLPVMLDSTTVRNALDCVEGYVTPTGLMDLAVVAFAAVCFERIILQPKAFSPNDLPPPLDAAVLQLVYPRHENERFPGQRFIDGTLSQVGIPSQLNDGAGQRLVADEFEAGWSRFLRLPPKDIRLNLSYSRFQPSPSYWSGIPASEYIWTAFQGANADDELRDFLSVQTIRALFNDGLAGFLGIPYLSTSIRAPVQSEILRRKIDIQLLLDKLLSSIGPKPLRSNKRSVYMCQCSAPFVLALILQRIEKPHEFWQTLTEYRSKFEPLRRRIAEDRNKWEERRGQYLSGLTKHFTEFSETANIVGESVTAGAVFVTTVATGTEETSDVVKAGIKLLKLIKPTDMLYKLYTKYFRPELYLLFNLAEEARRLGAIEKRIETVWGTRWGRAQHDQLEWLAAAQPGDFLKLRNIG
jgi:hypothetical protein